MAFGSTMEAQTRMAQEALNRAAIRNHSEPPAPQPVSVTVAEPCASAVTNSTPYVGGNNG